MLCLMIYYLLFLFWLNYPIQNKTQPLLTDKYDPQIHSIILLEEILWRKTDTKFYNNIKFLGNTPLV